MTSRKYSVLDLFMLVKDEGSLSPELANELLVLAHQTLASLDPEYQAKGYKYVLDDLEAHKRFDLHDLAVLCYEALS